MDLQRDRTIFPAQAHANHSASSSPRSARLRFRDVLGAVAVGSLHRIDDKVLPHPEIRVDILPNDLLSGRHLEEPAEPAFVDIERANATAA